MRTLLARALLTIAVLAVPTSVRADDDSSAPDDDTSAGDDQSPDGVSSSDDDDTPSKKPAAPPAMPHKIDICITSAVVAPTKSDGSPWDVGGNKMDEEERKVFNRALLTVAKAAAKHPAGAAAALGLLFAKPALQAFGKPDVYGSVELAPAGAYDRKNPQKIDLASRKKPVGEFRPSFGRSACFWGVAWNTEMRLSVSLVDKDAINDDRIATVGLVAKDVAAAFAVGKPWHVYVADQDTNQLGFVVLEVSRSAE